MAILSARNFNGGTYRLSRSQYSRKIGVSLCIAWVVGLFLLYRNWKTEWRWGNGCISEEEFNVILNNTSKKIIVFGNDWWGPTYKFPAISEANQHCSSCYFTQDKRLWGRSDAVVFHGHGQFLPGIVPERQRPEELWIFMMFEPLGLFDRPVSYDSIALFNGQFNWTMTHRRDSDIFVPYGFFYNLTEMKRPSFQESWAYSYEGGYGEQTYKDVEYEVTPSIQDFSNRKTAAWIVSRCESFSDREEIVQGLISEGLDVHVYGTCGTSFGNNEAFSCDVEKNNAKSGIDCRLQIRNKYKFYFAFEGSSCVDYVTEKFFDTSAATSMVPVVYGGADYAAMFPAKSFINVRDFKGVKELAEYLEYVGSHPEIWLEYFVWRQSYWAGNNRFVKGYCDLCEKLWNLDGLHPRPVKVYEKIWDWWWKYKADNEMEKLACEDSRGKINEVWKST